MTSFILVFVGIWAVVMAIWFFVSKAFRTADVDRIKSRLTGGGSSGKGKKGGAPDAKNLIHQEAGPGRINDLLKKYNLFPVIQTLLEQAGLKWDPLKLIHACGFGMVVSFGAAWSFVPGNFRSLAIVAALLGGTIPLLYVLRLRKKRLFRFEELFPESLEFVARSMRAGHAFSVSLEMIYKEFQEPLAGEFRRTFEEHNLGLPLEVALQKLAKRIPSLDVHFFVSAVLLQKRTGGNLAEILDKLAYIIRERFKLRGKIRAISAHGRMTGTALTLIPVGVAVLMFYVNPDYVKFFFTDEVGNMMLGAAVVLQLIGYAVIQKIVKIEI